MALRLFFALWPDVETTQQLARAAGALRLSPEARLVPRENYHLTLAFLGKLADRQLTELRRIGAEQRAANCAIDFDIYEYWPDAKLVVAAPRAVPRALAELWVRLNHDLHLEAAVRPHVTLARKVAQAPVLQAMSPFRWRALHFSLVCSDTSGAHSIYTVVGTWPLLDEIRKP